VLLWNGCADGGASDDPNDPPADACASGSCDVPADPCTPDPCSGHGTCASVEGGAACACDVRYAGSDCSRCAEGAFEFPSGSGACIDDPCAPDPCNGRGTCARDTGTPVCTCEPRFFGSSCASCAVGYTGAECDACEPGFFEFPAGTCIDDPCAPDPCSGHGTCDRSTGAAACACDGNFAGAACEGCVAGYAGAGCDTCDAGYLEDPPGSGLCADDPCLPDPCSGHGACAGAGGMATCACDAPYTGATCSACEAGAYEYPAGSGLCIDDPCFPDPCSGNGSCANATGAAVCTCTGNFSGHACDVCAAGYAGAACAACDVAYYEYPPASGLCVDDPCLPDPCSGNGTCANTTGAAVCACTGNFAGADCSGCVAGYTGMDCTTNIDDCAPNPCSNAGVCTDGIASFTCACLGAWDGPICEDIYFGAPAAMNDARLAETDATCREETFLDLGDWLPDPNPAYADPTLSITCNATTMSVTSNSVPQYLIDWPSPTRNSFANTLVPTVATYPVPRVATFNAAVTQATVVGGVGVAINGVQVSSPSASGGPLTYADPASIEVDGDLCDGHPNPSGKYHYHSLKTSCFFQEADDGDLAGDPCTAPSPIIAWIADGFPMRGPCECLDAACTQVVEMRSSWILMGGDGDPSDCAHQDYTYAGDAAEESDGDAYLDECSGHFGPAGDYHYHATNEYPWTLRCYRGTPMPSMTGGRAYDASAGGSDCCFENECTNGNFTNLNCVTMTCTP
jgi:hypothetical protein